MPSSAGKKSRKVIRLTCQGQLSVGLGGEAGNGGLLVVGVPRPGRRGREVHHVAPRRGRRVAGRRVAGDAAAVPLDRRQAGGAAALDPGAPHARVADAVAAVVGQHVVVVEGEEGVLGGGQEGRLVGTVLAGRDEGHHAGHGVVVADVPHGGAVGGRLPGGGAAAVDGPAVGLEGLSPEASGPPSEAPLLKHVLLGGINCPVVPLAGPAKSLRMLMVNQSQHIGSFDKFRSF